jgi:phosphoenolpyruvate carboxykinase (diphosphate)
MFPDQLEEKILCSSETADTNKRVHKLMHICLQLSALGYPCQLTKDQSYLSVADSLLRNYNQHRRLLADYRCPADQRIQSFLNDYFSRNNVDVTINLPGETFNLNEAGLAREISLPYADNHYKSTLIESFRVMQGVLHNPASDRRTTKGVFHIVEGGLPIPNDKRAVPVDVYAKLLAAALQPPDDLMTLPITSAFDKSINMWVSLLLRPEVRPEVENVLPKKTMETRMFVPGSLVANLDFVESIFGNAGDPFLPEHDAALDINHWTGHSGCIILAPQLTKLTKKSLGLPHYADATPRQIKDEMCWQQEDELYNDGQSFKIVCRDINGVIVTLIADNYFGYSKKEIKSQISYSANLFGGCEEEHAGGALAFPRFNLGEIYMPRDVDISGEYTFDKLCKQLEGQIDRQKEGYAIDKNFDDILYIAENTIIDMQQMHINWYDSNNEQHNMPLLSTKTYVYPSGFSVQMRKHPHAPSWRLIGTLGEGTLCHKPSTVSGGGKSEISKSIQDLMISGTMFVGDFEEDFNQIQEIFSYDFSQRFRNKKQSDERSLLNKNRSLGSVIRLLTPSSTKYTDEYNQWLSEIPPNILALVYMIKRFYQPEWGSQWRQRFSVDEVNGLHGHELKFNGRKLEASYLRVGTHSDGTWRLFKLRQDFVAAGKIQLEDDITASTVVPVSYLTGLRHNYDNQSVKLVHNCESRLFQRPDEAINRGLDKQTESDLASCGNFISNFEPLETKDAIALVNDVVNFEKFTSPMRKLIQKAADAPEDNYFVSSAQARIVDGKPSPNVRYLQLRPDLVNPKPLYLAKIGIRLARGLKFSDPVYFPVDAVLQGRRNNPQDKNNNIRPLAVYNPIHYQQLPELFMDLICSLTGKSPSTTGAGSEGALTKGPFNALSTTADLNTALVSFILCGHDGFSSAAGYIGHSRRVDHDISMLIPEIWSRLDVKERQPDYLINKGYFEKLNDFEHNGRKVLASRLGYRITKKFVHAYFGKIFDSPMIVFDEAMLCPERQDMEAYIDGIHNIVEAHQRVAQNYINDGTIDDACPPLQALLTIMATGQYQGKTIDNIEIRHLFTRDYLLQSDWYKERLITKQKRDTKLWQMNHDYVEKQLSDNLEYDKDKKDFLLMQKKESERMIKLVSSKEYLHRLNGTLGADWVHK